MVTNFIHPITKNISAPKRCCIFFEINSRYFFLLNKPFLKGKIGVQKISYLYREKLSTHLLTLLFVASIYMRYQSFQNNIVNLDCKFRTWELQKKTGVLIVTNILSKNMSNASF